MKRETKVLLLTGISSILFILLAGIGLCNADTLLDVDGIKQEQNNWCWAASAKAILQYYGTDVDQCDIVNYGWGRNDCCVRPSSSDCDKGGFVGKTTPGNPDVLGHWGVTNTYVGAALTQANCVSEINAGRPIAMIWQWILCPFDYCKLEKTHAMVVDGYDLNGQYLNYMDPADGEYHKSLYTWVLYTAFSGLGSHEWIASHRITTNPKPGAITVNPSSGSWTSSPHNLSVSSSGATTIYYTMVNTYDGSTPGNPAAPTSSSNNGSISGPSGTFQLYASSGQYKKSKLRFIGCNRSGCGSASGVFSYTIDLRGSALPNLTPYQPSGWSDKILVSKTTGTNADSSPLYTTDKLYVDWAVRNNGTASASTTFYTYLYVDGTLKASWYTSSLSANYYTSVKDYSLGSLSAGTHTIKIVTDATGVISESNESDNSYTKTITVQSSSSTPTLLVDGGTSSTKAQGGTFSLTGSNYTPNGTVFRYVNGTAISSIIASSSGTITNWTWQTDCATATGTYTVYAKDNTTGKSSNNITEIVTANTNCAAPQYEGWLDAADCSSISGWAWNKNSPNTPISVDIYNGGTKLTTVTANIFRQDLVNAGKGNGYHGFSYSTPGSLKDGNSHSINVKFGGISTNLSGSPKTITCGTTINPTIAMSPMSGPGGTVFTEWGTGFTPNSTATLYFPKYDGVNNGSSQVAIDATGHFEITYPSGTNKPPGNYKWYAIDGPTGKKSNEVTFTITVSPTIAMSPMSGKPGTVFTEWGTGFTPNSTATLYFPKYDGVNNGSSQVAIDSIGHFEITYPSGSNKPKGSYSWYAIDGPTGKKSNTVTFVIN